MNNIFIIMKKEMKDIIRDKAFITASLLFMMLSILSVYIGSTTKHAEMSAYFQTIELLKAKGITSFPDAPKIFTLTILKNNIVYVGIAGALSAVFLSFNIFTKEKENGNIKLLLTRPVFRDEIITGKILSGLVIIAAMQILIFIINTGLVSFIGNIKILPDEILKLGIFSGLSVFYMMFFFMFGFVMSIYLKHSETVFMAAVIMWISTGYIIPQLSDTQKKFNYYTNSVSQTIIKIPQETKVSKMIDLFSPYVHFEKAGRVLLQDIPEKATEIVNTVMIKTVIPESLYILLPLLILFAAVYYMGMRYEVGNYE